MKQRARQTMLLLAAVCGEAVHVVAAAHSGSPIVDVPLEATITYGIAAWRLHVTIPVQRARDVSVSDACDCYYTLMVRDGKGRQTAVGVSYVESSRPSRSSYAGPLRCDSSSVVSVDLSSDVRPGDFYTPYPTDVDCTTTRWDSLLWSARSQWDPVGMVPHVTSAGMRLPELLLEKFGADRAISPGMASTVFSSPGVVLLNGLGVILIGWQLRRRLL